MSIITYQPLELVCLDLSALERLKGGFVHVLVMTDHFSRFAIAILTKNMKLKPQLRYFIRTTLYIMVCHKRLILIK